MTRVRDQIRMTPDEVAAFLAEPHKLQLATINRDGTPHLVTMYYVMVDQRIGFWTYRTSQKAANLRRDPRVSCLVETGDGYDQLRGVLVTGTVEAVDGYDRVRELGAAIYGRYVDLGDGWDGFIDEQAKKRVAYLVTPQSTASWDHRKLAAVYAAAGSG